MRHVQVKSCGPCCTIQDQGRPGWSSQGIPEAGAMDLPALRAANLLVGNQDNAAAIELGLTGARLCLEGGPARIAICGARTKIRVNGDITQDHTCLAVIAGDEIEIRPAHDGVFAYLAIDGGFATPSVFDSRSSDPKAGLGFEGGQPIKSGALLPVGEPRSKPDHSGSRVDPTNYARKRTVRAVPGAQIDYFDQLTIDTLFNKSFCVSPASNRMAYRLDGPLLSWNRADDMVSDATLLGSIQVPRDGHALVLMPDRQTIGGYPKIATVIPEDLHILAQTPPGSKIYFQQVSLEEASRIAAENRHAPTNRIYRSASPQNIDHAALLAVADAAVDAVNDHTWTYSTAAA